MKIICSYFGNRILKHVENDMKTLSDLGFTGVVHTFSENDLKYYSDSFKDIVRVSQDAGLDVDLDPWGVGRVFGGETFSHWIAENHDKLQISRNGTLKPIACLNHPEFRSFMKNWVVKAAQTGTNGLFWDEPHMYIPAKSDNQYAYTCCCNVCQSLYRDQYGYNMPQTITDDVVQFRNWTLISFLEEMLALGKASNLRNSVCLLPDELITRSDSLDWSQITALPGIDILSTDPYWTFTDIPVVEFVRNYSQRIINTVKGSNIEPQIWIQGFRIKSGDEDNVRLAIETASAQGINNLAFWGFEACAQMSFLACQNSEKVWNTALHTFASLKKM